MSWQDSTLGELTKLDGGLIQTGPFGSQLHQAEYESEGIPVVMPKDIADGRISGASVARVSEQTANRLQRHKLKPQSIVLPRRGEVTKRAFIRDEQEGWLCGTGCLKIELDGRHLVPAYLYYFMEQEHVTKWLLQHAVGTTMLNLSAGIVSALPIRYPTPDVQRAIADNLATYDDLIENNRRRMALLEESARLLYREWFVRLRFPGYEHTLVVDGVPQGWSITNFGSVVTNFDRLRKPLSILEREQREGEFPYHGAAGILSHIDGFLFDGRYLLIGEDGTVQTSAGNPMLQLVEGRFWVSNHAHVVQGATVSTEFLYCLLADYPIQGHVTGVAQPKITQANLNRIPVMVPSESLQTVFQEFAATIFNQRFSLQSQNQKLRAARDLLLPRLMSGELAV
jgi:type I restriction enzyme S subunit